MDKMASNGIRRKDTTKGPPLRILSLGNSLPFLTRRSLRSLTH